MSPRVDALERALIDVELLDDEAKRLGLRLDAEAALGEVEAMAVGLMVSRLRRECRDMARALRTLRHRAEADQ